MTPNIPLPSPDPPKPRILPPVKPPRIIIEHFDLSSYKIDQAHGYVEADCQHCGATIKGQKNVTSNFIQHMRRRHPEAYELFSKSSTQRAKRPRLLTPAPTKSPTSQATHAPIATPLPTSTIAPIPPLPSPAPHPVSDTTTPTPPIRASSRPQLFTDPSSPNRSDMILETALISATYRGAERTPCDLAQALSLKTSCQVYLKREDLQIAGSPIFRAAYNYLAAIPTARSGVLAAGETALPVAAAANKHVKPCHVILPASTPAALLKKLAKFDAKFDVVGGTVEECVARAVVKATEMNRTYVDVAGPRLRPGCEDAVAGYATLALELLQQCPHANRVFVAAGNALLFSGLSVVLQRLGRGVKLIGVMLDARCDDADIVGKRVVEKGAEMVQATTQQSIQEDWAAFTEDVVRVGRAEMCAGVRSVFEDCDGRLLEPVGALSVAGAVKYARMHKLSHERMVAVIEAPLRSFERLGMIISWSWRADESECILCVQGRSEGDGGGARKGLNVLMHEVGGTVGGGVRMKSLRFGGKWPLLLGLACNETTTAAMHLANLVSLGYNVTDVTGSELSENELWTWGEEDSEGEGEGEVDVRWGLFRVEVMGNGAVEFLAVERPELELRKVSFTDDDSGVGRLIVAAKGTEVQLVNLEREMREHAMSVRRLRGKVDGLKVLGCRGGDSRNGGEVEGGEMDVSNGEVVVKAGYESVEVENGGGGMGTHVDGVDGAEGGERGRGEEGGGEGGGGGRDEKEERERGEEGGGSGGEGVEKEARVDGSIVFTQVVEGEGNVEGGEVEAVTVVVADGEAEAEAEAENGRAEGGDGVGGAEVEVEAEAETDTVAEVAEVAGEEVAMEVETTGREQEGVVIGVSGGEIVEHGDGDGVEGGEEVEVVGECEGGEVEEHGEVEHEEMDIGEGEEVMAVADQV